LKKMTLKPHISKFSLALWKPPRNSRMTTTGKLGCLWGKVGVQLSH
jgi:hypothetical protein